LVSGFFLTFEGGEGAGKTTQIRALATSLAAQGRDVVVTREPGGSAGAEALREFLLFGQHDLSARSEIFAMFAARADHVDRVIAPALAAGKIVLCDRFTDSTEAYQGYGRASGDAGLLALVAALQAQIGLSPSLTLLLTVPRDIARVRVASRGGREDRFETSAEEFHARVAKGFVAIAAREPERCTTIDASLPIDEVAARVSAVVTEALTRAGV